MYIKGKAAMKKALHFINNLRLKTKIISGFSIIFIIVLVSNLYTNMFLGNINEKLENTLNEDLSLLILAEQISANMSERTSMLQGYLLSNDDEYRVKFEDSIKESIALEEKLLSKIRNKETKELVEKKYQWGTLTDEVYAEWDKGNKTEAIAILNNDVQPLEHELTTGFNNLALEQGKRMEESAD